MFLKSALPRAGTAVSATSSDATSTYESESAKGTSSWRTVPVVKTMGRKTHTVVSVEATTAPPTWRAPWAAARAGE